MGVGDEGKKKEKKKERKLERNQSLERRKLFMFALDESKHRHYVYRLIRPS